MKDLTDNQKQAIERLRTAQVDFSKAFSGHIPECYTEALETMISGFLGRDLFPGMSAALSLSLVDTERAKKSVYDAQINLFNDLFAR